MEAGTPAPIESERLRLRRFEQSDAGSLMHRYGDPEVMRYLDEEAWTFQRIRAEIRPDLTTEHRGYPRHGYRIGRRCRHRGYATEIAETMVRWAFEELELRAVYATTMAVNRGSRRVLEKVGLRSLRTIHLPWPNSLPGTEGGEVVYGLTRGDWRKPRE